VPQPSFIERIGALTLLVLRWRNKAKS